MDMGRAERRQAVNGASDSRQTAAGAQKEKGVPAARPLEEARGGGSISAGSGEAGALCVCGVEEGGTWGRGKSRRKGAEKMGLFKTRAR